MNPRIASPVLVSYDLALATTKCCCNPACITNRYVGRYFWLNFDIGTTHGISFWLSLS